MHSSDARNAPAMPVAYLIQRIFPMWLTCGEVARSDDCMID
jgi:hypothetical protein